MSFHTYTLNELYTNAEGSIQFIELSNGHFFGQDQWRGQTLSVSQGAVVHSFTFPTNLTNSNTGNTKVLVATQAFADLGIVKPDFIVPANFLFTSGAATVNFAGVDALGYTRLPSDGVHSLGAALQEQINSPTNYARVTGTVPEPTFNVVTGSAAADTLLGTTGRDRIDALAGNDMLDGGAGDDQLNGGDGTDTARLHGPRAAFTVAVFGATISGPDGNDVLSSVERAAFNDVSSEFLSDGAAAKSVKLISAVFGRSSITNQTFIGIGVNVFDGGASYLQVADLALHARLGPAPSNTELVQLLYTNVVGSAPDAATTALFVGFITSGQHTQASLTTLAADHPLNLAIVDLVGLATHGIDYLPVVG